MHLPVEKMSKPLRASTEMIFSKFFLPIQGNIAVQVNFYLLPAQQGGGFGLPGMNGEAQKRKKICSRSKKDIISTCEPGATSKVKGQKSRLIPGT